MCGRKNEQGTFQSEWKHHPKIQERNSGHGERQVIDYTSVSPWHHGQYNFKMPPEPRKRARPSLCGDNEGDVVTHLKAMRCTGSVICLAVVVAAADAIVNECHLELLEEIGATIEFSLNLAKKCSLRKAGSRRRQQPARALHQTISRRSANVHGWFTMHNNDIGWCSGVRMTVHTSVLGPWLNFGEIKVKIRHCIVAR